MSYFPPTGSVVSYQIVPSSLLSGASIFGQLPDGTATLGSVAAIVSNFPGNQSVSGTVVASLVGVGYTNAADGLSAGIQLAVTGFNRVWNGATWDRLKGNSAIGVLVNTGAGSVILATGSILAFQAGTFINSIISSNPSSTLVGGYVHRNDTVASFLGGNTTWNPLASDSAGRVLTKPFSSEDGTIVSYQSSLTSTSVTLVQASTLGKRVYITDLFLSNTGAATTLVTLQDGSTSIIGQFIVPTNGGNNAPGIAIPLKTAPAQDLAWKSNTATSMVYLTLKGYVAP